MKCTLILLSLALMVSCSTHKKVKSGIDQEVAGSNVSSSEKLGETIHELINHSESFTEDQKKELHRIFDDNKKLAMDLAAQSYQYRGVLVKELLGGKVSTKRINLIKKDIERIESLRLKNTFDTVQAITDMVKSHPEEKEFAPHIINFEGSAQMLR